MVNVCRCLLLVVCCLCIDVGCCSMRCVMLVVCCVSLLVVLCSLSVVRWLLFGVERCLMVVVRGLGVVCCLLIAV